MARERVGLPADRVEAEVLQEVVDEAVLLAEHVREDQGDGGGRDDVGQEHAHAPERLAADVLVQHGRDDDGGDQLRDGGEHEDAEGVEQGVPEELVLQHVHEVGEADEVALPFQEVPVVERDDERVDEGEETDEAEQDEERGDVEVRRRLDVEAAEAMAPRRLRRRGPRGPAARRAGLLGAECCSHGIPNQEEAPGVNREPPFISC